jgi:hypothetical protein
MVRAFLFLPRMEIPTRDVPDLVRRTRKKSTEEESTGVVEPVSSAASQTSKSAGRREKVTHGLTFPLSASAIQA